MADAFKPGDKVRLKSGGPTMTVNWVGDQLGTMSAHCEWFDKTNKPQDKVFAVTSLELDP